MQKHDGGFMLSDVISKIALIQQLFYADNKGYLGLMSGESDKKLSLYWLNVYISCQQKSRNPEDQWIYLKISRLSWNVNSGSKTICYVESLRFVSLQVLSIRRLPAQCIDVMVRSQLLCWQSFLCMSMSTRLSINQIYIIYIHSYVHISVYYRSLLPAHS